MSAPHSPSVAAVVAAARPRNGERWTCLGTGHGRLAIAVAAAAPGAAVVGVDPVVDADPRAAQAAARDAGVDDRVSFDEGDLHALPAPDATFDGAILDLRETGVADDDRAAVLAEVRRVLVAGGRVVLADEEGRQAAASRLLAAAGFVDVETEGLVLTGRRPGH